MALEKDRWMDAREVNNQWMNMNAMLLDRATGA